MNRETKNQRTTMKEIEAWVARDFNGVLCMYLKKPVKMSEQWSHFYNLDFLILDDRLFPEVKWTDDEPKGIVLSIQNEKSKIKSALSFLIRIALFVFILSCTVVGLIHVIQWIIWQTFIT